MNSENGTETFKETLFKRDELGEAECSLILSSLSKSLNDEIQNVSLLDMSQLTANHIYLLTVNNKHKIIIKIRHELPSMSFDDEAFYLKNLDELEIVPKQYFALDFGEKRLTAEEFINGSHIPDGKTLDKVYIDSIIDHVVIFNSLSVIPFNERDLEENKKFFLWFLVNGIAKTGREDFHILKDKFEKTRSEKLRAYYSTNQHKFKLLEQFMNEKNDERGNFLKFIPRNSSSLVFSHNDVHNNNCFYLEGKVKFIDFEDISYNTPGFDLSNYIYESMFEFTETHPFYIFSPNLMNKTDDELLELFHIFKLKLEERNPTLKMEPFTIQDIYKLFCLSHIKGIYEYITMYNFEEAEFEKEKRVDLIFLAYDVTLSFNQLKEKIA